MKTTMTSKMAQWDVAFGSRSVKMTASAKARAEIVAGGNARQLAAFDSLCRQASEHLWAEVAADEDGEVAEDC